MARTATRLPSNDREPTAGARPWRWTRLVCFVVVCTALAGGTHAVLGQPDLPQLPPGPEEPLHFPRGNGVPAPLGGPAAGAPAVGEAPCPVPPGKPFVPSSKYIPGTSCEQPNQTTGPGGERILGTVPQATPAVRLLQNRFLDEIIDPQDTLNLVLGQTRVIILRATPRRVQIADETTANYVLVSPRELMIQGMKTGTTTLTLWFPDPQNENKLIVLSYYVRVFPDPEVDRRRREELKALARKINCLFCNSQIDLDLLGDKTVVTGRAYDIEEAVKILQILRTSSTVSGTNPVEGAAPAAPAQPVPAVGPPVPGPVDALLAPTPDQYRTLGGPNVINLLQVTGEQQVALHVVVAEVNRTAAREIGLNFAITNKNGQTVFQNNTGNLFNGGSATSIGAAAFTAGGANIFALLNGGRIPLLIDALRTVDYARSLAEPVLTTLNGTTAHFQAGGEFPVPVVTGNTAQGLQGVSFVPFGVQLTFTPFITDKTRIRMRITANVSTRDLATSTMVAGSTVSGLNTRNFDNTVELRDGETLAVAGLLQTNIAGDSSTVPGFGDLPFIGNFTGRRRLQAGEQELVILIRPELVHPYAPCTQPPLPGSDLFDPTDIEFYLFGRIESHHPVDYRAPIRDDLSRIHQYYELERKYVNGPTGFSEQP